jgi:hypothetical protein
MVSVKVKVKASVIKEEQPDKIIKAPPNYEQTHCPPECPFCHSPNPTLDMDMKVREFGRYFDINLYTCKTVCECGWNPGPIKYAVDGSEIRKTHTHKFLVKHEFITNAGYLKVYDRTHFKDVW